MIEEKVIDIIFYTLKSIKGQPVWLMEDNAFLKSVFVYVDCIVGCESDDIVKFVENFVKDFKLMEIASKRVSIQRIIKYRPDAVAVAGRDT